MFFNHCRHLNKHHQTEALFSDDNDAEQCAGMVKNKGPECL
ncbi:hypothetical protein AD28_0830 [Escherichia coli 2-210-07_S4_C3]|nr:hypothetical protein AD26_4578 [Escherichia coli 2-156-04_S4_C3]KDX71783.1 hypothetical protein AD28_0830 [Escherichia coli 2-210-07_S4_C3]KEM85570.1 hypothetical protein AC71_4502 [Escherichia coli 2-222-05_S4_C1]